MPNAHIPTPGGDQDPAPARDEDLVAQIIDVTLSDARVTRTVSAAGLVVLRETLLAGKLAKPIEIVAAANHEEQQPETP